MFFISSCYLKDFKHEKSRGNAPASRSSLGESERNSLPFGLSSPHYLWRQKLKRKDEEIVFY